MALRHQPLAPDSAARWHPPPACGCPPAASPRGCCRRSARGTSPGGGGDYPTHLRGGAEGVGDRGGGGGGGRREGGGGRGEGEGEEGAHRRVQAERLVQREPVDLAALDHGRHERLDAVHVIRRAEVEVRYHVAAPRGRARRRPCPQTNKQANKTCTGESCQPRDKAAPKT